MPVEITKYLLFASRRAIRGVSLESNAAGLTPPEAIAPIVSSESTFVAVDYDAADDYIYYSDVRRSSVHRIRTNGTGTLRDTALAAVHCEISIHNYTCVWGTGIGGLMRGMATIPQGYQELLVVRDKVGRPPGELGASKSLECDNFSLQCFDTVGWATGRASGL